MPFPLTWHGIIGFLIEMYKENKKKQIIMFVKKAKEKIRIHNELQMNKKMLVEIRENQKTIDKKLTLILERLDKINRVKK